MTPPDAFQRAMEAPAPYSSYFYIESLLYDEKHDLELRPARIMALKISESLWYNEQHIVSSSCMVAIVSLYVETEWWYSF